MKFIVAHASCFIFALYFLLVAWFSGLPVFWDMYGQVKTASYFLDTHFTNILPNGNGYSDNGHFPLYSLYLAGLFKVFGYKLWVAHFSVLPFIYGLLRQLRRFSGNYLAEKKIVLVLLLTLVHPAILTQALYFSNELAIAFVSLWMINSLVSVRASHIALSSILLCLLNLRGISLVIVFLIWFLSAKKSKEAWYLLCGIFTWLVWMFIHYRMTGWLLQNPENMEHRSVVGIKTIFLNFGISVLKLFELGSFVPLIIIVAITIGKKQVMEPLKIFLLCAVATILPGLFLSNPVSNHYFLLCYVLLIPVFIHAVTQLHKKIFYGLTFLSAVSLVAANWISLPDRYAKAWDCSLKSLSYFDLRRDLDEYVRAHHISPNDVAAGFQVYFNDRYYLMNDSQKQYALLSDTEMNNEPYIVDSNICNNYNPQRPEYLKANYSEEITFRKGSVYLTLYKRKLSKEKSGYEPGA